jgi:inosine triphosphate pyrophosphatase
MKDVVFVTGSDKKAEYLSKLLGVAVPYEKIDLPELQSLNLTEIVETKLEAAYEILKRPVLVEDVALEFTAFGRLPGTLIKWFRQELTDEELCRLLDGRDRSAIARCTFGYYDGNNKVIFQGSLSGSIPKHPAGDNGFGWDRIFIPEGYTVTRAELSTEDDEATYLMIKPVEKVRNFLLAQD